MNQGVGGISGNAGFGPLETSGQEAQKLAQDARTASQEMLSDANKDLKEEIRYVSKDKLGTKTKKETETSATNSKTAQKKEGNETAIEHSAGLMSAMDELEKKKKKERKNKEDKLLAMSVLEGRFEAANLNEDEKEVVDEFFSNLKLFKKIKEKLSSAEDRHEHHIELLKKKKKQDSLKNKKPSSDSKPPRYPLKNITSNLNEQQ